MWRAGPSQHGSGIRHRSISSITRVSHHPRFRLSHRRCACLYHHNLTWSIKEVQVSRRATVVGGVFGPSIHRRITSNYAHGAQFARSTHAKHELAVLMTPPRNPDTSPGNPGNPGNPDTGHPDVVHQSRSLTSAMPVIILRSSPLTVHYFNSTT